MRKRRLYDDDGFYTFTFEDNDERKFYAMIKNDYYKGLVDLTNVHDLLCIYYHIDEETGERVKSNCSRSEDEALSGTYLYYDCYGDCRRTSYKDLILNLPIIDFRFLLRIIDTNSITMSFVDIFKVAELYPSELSNRLDFEKHDEIIEKYADKLNWKTILSKNIPLETKHVKKYFKYFYDESTFYGNKKQTYDKECLQFMIESLSSGKEFSDIYKFSLSTSHLLETLLDSHDFDEDHLFTILNTVKKCKDLEKNRRDYVFDNILTTIFRTQNITENLILRFKQKSMFKRYRIYINQNVNFTEKFIEKNSHNPEVILWDSFSINPNVLYGRYSNDFYETYCRQIDWSKFTRDVFIDFSRNDKKRFKEFVVKFSKYIEDENLVDFLLHDRDKYFSIKEMLKYFKDQLMEIKKINYNDWFISNNFCIAVCKSGNPNFEMCRWLGSERHKADEDLKLVKNEILTSMIKGELKNLNVKILDRINSIIEDSDILSMKKEIFTEMLNGDFNTKVSEAIFERINNVLNQK